jgi:hypothetical protein
MINRQIIDFEIKKICAGRVQRKKFLRSLDARRELEQKLFPLKFSPHVEIPVRNVSALKRYGRGCKPRPAMQKSLYSSLYAKWWVSLSDTHPTIFTFNPGYARLITPIIKTVFPILDS